MQITIKIPFGDGEATVTGDFSPPVETNWYCPMEDAEEPHPGEYDIDSFCVGGVDIMDELLDLQFGIGKRYNTSFWEHLVDKCYERAYDEYINKQTVGEEI